MSALHGLPLSRPPSEAAWQTQETPSWLRSDKTAARAHSLNVLFICSQNKLRSPTAEQVFAAWPGVEVDSAGLNNDAENPVTPETVAWADLIFVMEKGQRTKLAKRFRKSLRARVVCLDIPDDYGFMDAALVAILQARAPRFLPSSGAAPRDRP